ncbi:MAG: HAMP domain-containing histidine kinase [Bacteroidaceae bacterium]|nr:HAMP domain-containing histidine kinase [Bacteroidaceae bacterium]
MLWIKSFRYVKSLLIFIAAIIAGASLYISDRLVSDLKTEELNKMRVWAEAMRSLNNADENTDLNLVLTVLNSNNSIPVVVLDAKGGVNSHRNINIPAAGDSLGVILQTVTDMRSGNNIIRIDMGDGDYLDVCYSDSIILKRLSYYPYIQLIVVLLFFVICLVAIVSSKRAEQNKVWVGLSKETAHQLGTPISSLMAWQEVLREKYPDEELLPEMGKDIDRLQLVAERFSKIGSMPEPISVDLLDVIDRTVDYFRHRTSQKVEIVCKYPRRPLLVRMNAPLIEWVLENLCKNAIDAMNGEGRITFTVSQDKNKAYVEVSDTGRGIAKSRYKTVFEPGYTTKKRGWGLGLSLAKRIMEQYHDGRIYVKHSELGKGTIFKMELRK